MGRESWPLSTRRYLEQVGIAFCVGLFALLTYAFAKWSEIVARSNCDGGSASCTLHHQTAVFWSNTFAVVMAACAIGTIVLARKHRRGALAVAAAVIAASLIAMLVVLVLGGDPGPPG